MGTVILKRFSSAFMNHASNLNNYQFTLSSAAAEERVAIRSATFSHAANRKFSL